MGERQGHPVAGALAALVTCAVVGSGGIALYLAWSLRDSDPPALRLTWVDLVPWMVLLFAVLAGGLWTAWRVNTGYWVRGPQARPEPSPPSHPTWRVAEPGVDLTVFVDGEVEVVAHLAAGDRVTEVRRVSGKVRVSIADGRTGWVAADRLEPAVQPTGGRGGGGDG